MSTASAVLVGTFAVCIAAVGVFVPGMGGAAVFCITLIALISLAVVPRSGA